ncbi:sigma factor-like helix-turn-helix DNA-binding protein [Paenibacillus tuaregi]|uniref:sigma factor-like helix-turn-helix DNA-binding protein n=1 Tax=Paenibacillus tuaregi TaxID=1816681 RepID=UPI000B12A457|nr:sigma factor-like helix-turn-helix DNA-binding protein [Paenibacillus tuaregi]
MAGVKKLLRDRHAISAARFTGDTAASDILIDLNSAINSAGLSERQTEAVALVSGFDLTQKEAAAVMGNSREAVAKLYEEAAVKIAEVYKRWEYGEVTAEYELETEEEAA